jgi:hypothetical protein
VATVFVDPSLVLGQVHPLSDECFLVVCLTGYHYIVTFIDMITHYVEIILLKNKDDVFNEFRKFIILEENQTGFKLKRLYSDNDLKYRNKLFDLFLTEKGVIITYVVSYAHE